MQEIYELELRMLSRQVRSSPEELGELLADDFIEIGSSGKMYTKQKVIRALLGEKEARFIVSDFETHPLSPRIVLATYQVEKILEDDHKAVHSLRSSIWKMIDNRWQMIFHQGTRVLDRGQ